MAVSKGKKNRGIFSLRGGKVDLAIGVLAAAILESHAAHAEGIKFDGLSRLSDPSLAKEVDGLLHQAVATNDIHTLSVEELRALLTPEHLAELGIDAQEFTHLLEIDPEAALAKLEAAFATKLKLASFEGAHKSIANFAAHEDAGGLGADGGAGSGGGGGISPALIIGGVIAAGVGVGFLVGSGGNGNGGQSGQAVNSPPLANADTVSATEDAPLKFDPRTNDTDANSDALTITQVNGTAITTTAPVTIAGVGVISLNSDGTLTFTPVANYNGPLSFTYQVSDGKGGLATGNVTGTVAAVNDAPVAVNDAVTTTEDKPVTFDPRTNDTDVDGPSKTITQINGASISTTTPVSITGVGVVSLNADGTLTFTPAANFNGTPSFTYTISDGAGGTATGTVNLTITPVNDAPVNTVVGDVTGLQNATIAITGLSVADADGGTLTTTLHVGAGALTIGAVTGGAVIIKGDDQTYVLTGTADQINASLKALSFVGGPSLFGDQTLTITTTDGIATDTDSLTLHIGQVSSQVIALSDGYISGAFVFIDVNGNGVFDGNDLPGISDGTGHYLIVGNGTGALIATGGTNLDTGLPNLITFKAPAGSSAINPLTTVIQGIIDASGGTMTAAQANAALVTSLGLPAGTDLLHLDILSSSTDSSLQLAAQKEAAKIALVLDAAIHAGANPAEQATLFANIAAASAAAAAAGTHLDLSNSATLGSLFTGIGLPADVVDTLAATTASSNAAVDAATTLGGVSDVQQDAPTGAIITLTDAQAVALAGAGVPFAASDIVVVDETGTPSVTLKQLQDLKVDLVKGHAIAFSIDAGSGGLAALSTGGALPTFSNATAGAPFDVTLNIASGTLAPTVDLSTLAPALGAAGIDHIDVGGDNHLVLTSEQGLSFVGSGVDFVAGDDVTITTSAGGIAAVVGSADGLHTAGIDHIDVTGDSITINDDQAASLIHAGLDFVDGDVVTLDVTGTTSTTTLKGLQDLHVDLVKGHAVSFSIAGGDLGGVTADGLPTFSGADGGAIDVSLIVDPGTVNASVDFSALAPALGAAGIDHIDVGGSGNLTLSADQALSFVNSGVDFNSSDNITITTDASGIAAVVGGASDLGAEHVDHIDVSGDGHLTIDDSQAAALVSAGLDFVDSDDITLEAHGTHVSTSLGGLQALHVDTITGDETTIKLALGQIDETSALPTFDASKDVTVDLSDSQTAGLSISDLDHLTTLATSLHDAGVDHIGISQSFDTLTQDQLDTISQIETSTGIDFVYDPTPVASSDFGTLLSLLEATPTEADVPSVVVSDAAIQSSIDSGALQSFLGETLVVDATDSGDHLLTSLKSLGDLGVDNVLLSDHGTAPVYVDLGFDSATPTASELSQLLATVDPTGANEPLFSGTSHVGLVVDQAALDALAGVDGSLGHLADIGITEIDVLGGTKIPDALLHDSGIEIKLIGIDDDLYEHLHHDK